MMNFLGGKLKFIVSLCTLFMCHELTFNLVNSLKTFTMYHNKLEERLLLCKHSHLLFRVCPNTHNPLMPLLTFLITNARTDLQIFSHVRQ